MSEINPRLLRMAIAAGSGSAAIATEALATANAAQVDADSALATATIAGTDAFNAFNNANAAANSVGSKASAFYGTATPSVGIGVNNDIYIQSITNFVTKVWKKVAGVWISIGDVNPSVWTSFNPSATAEFGSITTFFGQDGAYKIIQDMVFFWTYAVINNQGTGSGALLFGLPAAIWLPGGAASFGQVFPVRVAFGGGSNISGMAYFVTGGSGNYELLKARSYDGTTPVGSGNGIYISGVYQKT